MKIKHTCYSNCKLLLIIITISLYVLEACSDESSSAFGKDASKHEIHHPMHTLWGAVDYSNDFSNYPPDGVPLPISESNLKSAFGLEKDPVFETVEKDLSNEGAELRRQSAAIFGTNWPWSGSQKKTVKSTRAQGNHAEHRRHMARLPEGASIVGPSDGDTGLDARGLALEARSPYYKIGLQEEGQNPEWQLCPDFGLDSKEFIVSGSTEFAWIKTVRILSTEGALLGELKRGCPAWTDSFSWTVPREHAQGCRNDIDPSLISSVDPNIVAADCQEVERQVLYTDAWSGILSPASLKVMDCHDDEIFQIYEERRDLYVQRYMIHSDFVVEDQGGNVIGYSKLDTPAHGLTSIGEHNFTIVDLNGKEIAKAVRPLRWAGGSKEHSWHVTLLGDSALAAGRNGTQTTDIGDMRVVAVAVANYVLRHQPEDLCSDVMLMVLPMLCTLAVIGILIGMSAAARLLAPSK